MHAIGATEGEERKDRICEDVMAQNSPDFMKNNLNIKDNNKLQWDKLRDPPRHIVNKLLKDKDKGRI